jgi:myo-inositol-1(or 4)-monophosphatase
MLQTAILAAREAGSILLDSLKKPRQTKVKGLRDIVTDADMKAQRAIIEIIQARFPNHDILSEESDLSSRGQADAKGHPYTWIVDPLDGTTNYSRRLPCFCTSIALSHRGEVILGVVYDPLRDDLFQAERGKGAYLNGESLRVSQVGSLADVYFHFSLGAWDAAAGALIVQEAGGAATDFTGHPWQTHSKRCLASNGLLHDETLSILTADG